MATTDTAICNSAIAKVGGALITSLDEASVRARLFKEQYPKIRDELLYGHPWRFAMKTVNLALVAGPSPSFYEHKYALPLDCLRVIDTDDNYSQWAVEDGFFLSNSGTALVRYVSRVTDASKFSPGFSELLSAKLAADLSYSMVQSVTLKQQLMSEYKDQLKLIRSYSAQEGSSKRVYADGWLNSRY